VEDGVVLLLHSAAHSSANNPQVGLLHCVFEAGSGGRKVHRATLRISHHAVLDGGLAARRRNGRPRLLGDRCDLDRCETEIDVAEGRALLLCGEAASEGLDAIVAVGS